jgi:hypothetical protein
MLHSPFAHNERRKANKAADGLNQNAPLARFVLMRIEVVVFRPSTGSSLSQRPRSPITAMLFFTLASHCRRAQRTSFDASGQCENMNSIHSFVAAN